MCQREQFRCFVRQRLQPAQHLAQLVQQALELRRREEVERSFHRHHNFDTEIPLELHFQWKVGVEHVQIGEEILTILWVSHD